MIRSLISEIKEFKKPSILASLFMVFEVMFEISIPFVMASLLDQGVQQRNMNNILFYGGLMLVCAFPVSYTHLDVYKRQIFPIGYLLSQDLPSDLWKTDSPQCQCQGSA